MLKDYGAPKIYFPSQNKEIYNSEPDYADYVCNVSEIDRYSQKSYSGEKYNEKSAFPGKK